MIKDAVYEIIFFKPMLIVSRHYKRLATELRIPFFLHRIELKETQYQFALSLKKCVGGKLAYRFINKHFKNLNLVS